MALFHIRQAVKASLTRMIHKSSWWLRRIFVCNEFWRNRS